LDSAIRKSNRVSSLDIAGTIRGLLSIEVGLGVVISNSVGVGVRRDLISISWGWSMISWSSMGNNWGMDSMGHNRCSMNNWSVDNWSMNSMGNNWSSMDNWASNNWGSVHSMSNWMGNNWGMDSMGNWVGNNWGMDSMGNWGMDSMGNWGMVDWGSMGNYWGMIGWGSMDSFWVLGSTIIGDISNIAIISIDMVVDMLDSAIRKSY